MNLKDKLLAFDCEATGLNPWGDLERWGSYPARPYAFSFSNSEFETEYVRFQVNPKNRGVNYFESFLSISRFEWLKKLLEDPTIIKIGHNIGYDIRMCRHIGIEVKGEIHDTLIMAHVVTGGSLLSYGLKELGVRIAEFPDEDERDLKEATRKARTAGKKLGWALATKELHGRDPIKADYWMAPDELCKRYAVQDAQRTMFLFLAWHDRIMNDPSMRRVYEREIALSRVVAKMENRGTQFLPDQATKLRKFYEAYRAKQLEIADTNGGKGLNFRSPKQMVTKFIDEKGYEPIYYTQKGNPQINGDSLKFWHENKGDKLAGAILESKGASHMISGFLDPYERFKVKENDKTWVLHPNYRQCGPVTGRFSCGDPNLMQVASPTTGRRKTEITLRPREAFGPRNGYIWYLPDYSQIEVWVFSFLAKEHAMCEALLQGRDFHGAVAEKVWGKLPTFESDHSYFRKRAKLLMFCKLYGGGVNKVAYLTDSTPEEAEIFVREFDTQLPGISTYMKRMTTKAEREGKIINPLGRTYYIDPNFCYRAVNYMVQGTSADILKNAMIRIDSLFTRKWNDCHILLTLHDELVIEVPLKYHSKKLMREIIAEMQRDSAEIGIPVPLPVGMKIAKKYWSDTIEIESLTKEWKDKYICKKIN